MTKKIVFINAVPYGSTGKIVCGIENVAKINEYKTLTFYSWTKSLKKSNADNVIIGSFISKITHIILAKLTGFSGCFSILGTLKLVNRIKKFAPDVINLHLLHSWSINLPILFKYLKKSNAKIIWTMHDCWAFTGQCPHYTISKCDKWKNGCHDCIHYQEFNAVLVDRTKEMWRLKKKWFTGVPNLTIVTPSEWLKKQIDNSFLSEYPVKVINNGVDLDVFKPTESSFRKDNSCEDKFVILGVAFDWGPRKGLDVFINLAHDLDKKYQIVLVGINEEIRKILPDNIIAIQRTQNQQELAEIYSSADVFVNPTREENYPTVNMESIACGTPVITYKTGGSPEIVGNRNGYVVPYDDYKALKNRLELMSMEKGFNRDKLVYNAHEFDMKIKYSEYFELMRM